MELAIIGVVVALNIIFILFKYEKQRYSDAITDTILLVLVTVVFMGSYAGLVVATVGSLIISIYLYLKPPKFPTFSNKARSSFAQEFKKRMKRKYDD